MNLTIVTPRYPPPIVGGGEVSADLLATSMADSKSIDNVQVLSFDGQERTYSDGVQIKRLGNIQSPLREIANVRAISKIRDHMYENGIIHSYNMDLHPSVGIISAIDSAPTVATLNSYDFFKQRDINVKPSLKRRIYELVGLPVTGRLMLECMMKVDAFIPLSNAVRDIYIERGFSGRKMNVVPNMLDRSFIDAGLDQNDNGGVILYVGGLRSGKGINYLIDSLIHLPDKYSLKIVGDGDRKQRLKTKVQRNSLGNQVTFAGSIPYSQLSKSYIESDIFVHPGVWPEPLNRTLFEAMQAQLPVVCTDIGGPPEVIPHDGLHVEPRNPIELANAIELAYDNKRSIGRTNQRYVYEEFTPDKIVRQIIGVYESVT